MTSVSLQASCQCFASLTNLLNALLRFVQSLFLHDSAEMTKGKDGRGANVVLQVVGAEPGLKKKVGPV